MMSHPLFATHKVTPFDRNEFKDPNEDDPNLGEGTNSYSVIPEEQAGKYEEAPIEKAFIDASDKEAAGMGGIELSTEAFNNKGAWPIKDPKVTKKWDGDPEDGAWEDTALPTDGFNIKRSKLGPHDNASTQINLPEDAAEKVMEAAAKIPTDELAEDGRENQPHVTIKYPVSEEDPEKLREAIANQSPFTITLGKCLVFPTDTAGQKALVAEAHGGPLLKLHKAVDAAIGGDPDKYHYRPHVTIAYISVDVAQEYEGSDLAAGISFVAEGITLSYASGKQEMVPFGRAMSQTAKVGFLVVKRCVACESGGCVEHEGL